MTIEAMKQALEALKNSHPYSNMDKDLNKHSEAITTLRTAIEEAEKQEPVAWMTHTNAMMPLFHKTRKSALNWETQPVPLYTAPVHASDISQERVDETAKDRNEPVAWLFQNEETGLTECIDIQQVEWGFEKNNPRWQKIAPLYTGPVHAIDISQERVDETEKDKHEFECPRCGHCCQQKEWVGLDGDIPSLGLVTEEFYNGMLCAEDILRKRNT
jgi:hypothetical protein